MNDNITTGITDMEKFFLKSKTIIGVIVSILPALLPEMGVSFTAEDGQFINQSVDQLIQGLGALFAVYGRIKASGGVTAKPKGLGL